MQLTFGDAEGLGKRKRTRKEIFLAEMEQVVPWSALLKLIEPHYPKMGRPGRQPYPIATIWVSVKRDFFMEPPGWGNMPESSTYGVSADRGSLRWSRG